MKRQEAIEVALSGLPGAKFITSCGLISRDAYAYNQNYVCNGDEIVEQPMNYLIPLTGSMGMTASLSAGLALCSNRVVAIMGDSDYMMGFNGLLNLIDLPLENLVHIVLVDGCYQSTGGQANVWNDEIVKMVKKIYSAVFEIETREGLCYVIRTAEATSGLCLIIVYIEKSGTESPRIPDESLTLWRKDE